MFQPYGIRSIQGNTTSGLPAGALLQTHGEFVQRQSPAASHWLFRGLTAYNPGLATLSYVQGYRCIIAVPNCPIMARKPAPASFGLKGIARCGQALRRYPQRVQCRAVRTSWRFRRYRFWTRECACRADMKLSKYLLPVHFHGRMCVCPYTHWHNLIVHAFISNYDALVGTICLPRRHHFPISTVLTVLAGR